MSGVGSPSEHSAELYVSAAASASRRTWRAAGAMLLVAALAFLTITNANSHWRRDRLAALASTESQYLRKIIGPPPTLSASALEVELYKTRYSAIYSAFAQEYAQSRSVSIPLASGTAADINDLGVIVGLSLVGVAGFLLLSISREAQAVEVCFAWGREQNCYRRAYELLAIGQLSIIARTGVADRTGALRLVTRFVLFIPLLVSLFLLAIDLKSMSVGLIVDPRISLLLGIEMFTLAAMSLITLVTYRSLLRLERLWDHSFDEYMRLGSGNIAKVELVPYTASPSAPPDDNRALRT